MNQRASNGLFAVATVALGIWAVAGLPSVSHPLGSDWGHYFTAAEYIWLPVDGLAYPDFRKPWYGWILGGLGGQIGYLAAAQWIGKASLFVLVCAAGLLTSSLGNRWCGLAAAFGVSCMPLAMDGALWVNHYPLMSAAVGLAFAAGAASIRWRSLVWVAVAGLAGSAAFALDLRGSIGLIGAGGLVLVGSLGSGVRSTVFRIALFSVLVGGIAGHDRWLQRAFDVPQLEFEQQLRVQRKGTLEQIRQGTFDDEALQNACSSQKLTNFHPSAAMDPCGTALRTASYRRLQSMRLMPGLGTVFAGFLLLLPFRTGGRKSMVRSSLAGTLVVGATVGSLWTGMSWVTYFDRYVMPFTVVFISVVPIAIARIGSWIPRFPVWLAGLLSLAWMLQYEPGSGARDLDAPELNRSSEYHAGEFARWARTEVGSQDSVLDCAGLAVDSVLLPSRISYTRYPPGDPQCIADMQSPPTSTGTFYLITMHRDIPTGHAANELPFDPSKIAELGYVPVQHDLTLEGYRLWSLR